MCQRCIVTADGEDQEDEGEGERTGPDRRRAPLRSVQGSLVRSPPFEGALLLRRLPPGSLSGAPEKWGQLMPEWLIGLLTQFRGATPLLSFAAVLASSSLLFAPPRLLEALGLSRLATESREGIGLAFLISSSLFLAQAASTMARAGKACWSAATAKVSNRRRQREAQDTAKRELRDLEAQLHSLTPDEQSYLALFIRDRRTSVRIPLQDGIAGGLRAKQILYLGSELGTEVSGHDHNLSQWAREYLDARPALLSEAQPEVEFRSPYQSFSLRSFSR